MSELMCPGESEPFIKVHFKYFDFLTRIWLYFLDFFFFFNNIEIGKFTDVTRSKIVMPVFPFIRNIACLLEQFSLGANKCIFIWKIKPSSWKRIKRHISCGLFLFCDNNFSFWSDRKGKSSIKKANSLESSDRTIVHLLVPLVYLASDSWKYTFCRIRNRWVLGKSWFDSHCFVCI